MKKIIAACLLLTCVYAHSHGQDTSKIKNKKASPYVKNYGPYTLTMENGKIISMVKNPNFDWSKVLKRDTVINTKPLGAVEIYLSNSHTPIIRKYLIHDLSSVDSERIMSKAERTAKYNSRAGVIVIHLKNGVIPLSMNDLLKRFNISNQNADLPIFIDYKFIAKRNEILAVPEAVLKIDVIKDTDGFRFLNVTTKEWDAIQKKNAGKPIMYIR